MKSELPVRACCLCERPIYNCNGAVHPGDFLDFIEGRVTDYKLVRETCGICITRLVIEDMEINMIHAKGGEK